jgi:hypothetical protein
LAVRRAVLVLVLAFLLLFTAFTAFLNVRLVKGYETIFIRASGVVEGTSKIVTADSVTYNFTGNINGSIIVERTT